MSRPRLRRRLVLWCRQVRGWRVEQALKGWDDCIDSLAVRLPEEAESENLNAAQASVVVLTGVRLEGWRGLGGTMAP